jgi:hypothetical protein
MKRLGDGFDDRTAEIADRTADIIAEGRAHRSALFAILDQLRRGDGPAPATG